MCTDISQDTTLLLWGGAMVRIAKDRDGIPEIVAHPVPDMPVVRFRQAKAPYTCTLHLVDGRHVNVDLACAEHWGDIQSCFPDECRKWPALGWGNDSDGHIEIDHVTDDNDREIPMDEFKQDVEDFIVYHED